MNTGVHIHQLQDISIGNHYSSYLSSPIHDLVSPWVDDIIPVDCDLTTRLADWEAMFFFFFAEVAGNKALQISFTHRIRFNSFVG